MKTASVQPPKSNVQRPQQAFRGARCFHSTLSVGRWKVGVSLQLALFFLTFIAVASALPPIRITNREYPDGSGSSREVDPSKKQSTESFYDSSRRLTHKIVQKLDERLAPLSAIMYNSKGIITQKSTYKLDGEDRVIQEVIYDSKDSLLGTKNYHYSTRNGSAIVVSVDTYDANGNLIQAPRYSKASKKSK